MHDARTERATGLQIGGGRYEIADRLGGGGTSDVYRGVDTLLDRPVAVKLFRPGADPTAERRFRDEARLLGPLAHPALVTIYDTGVEDGQAFQVLQLVDGVTLRERLADGPLDADSVAAIGARLAEVLAYVHSRGIVHRDVKPSNVLDDGDQVYLADFGISRLLDGAHVTATGLAVGTAAYMAPEQVRGEEVGPAADIYSLGLVLLECLTGRREYTGGTMEAAIARLSRPPLVSTGLPAPFPSLLAAMTRDDPRQRPSAAACAAALRDGGLSPAATAHPASMPVRVPAQRARPTGRAAVEVAPADVDATLTGAPLVQPRRRRLRGGLAVLGLAAAALIGTAALAPDRTSSDTPRTGPSAGSPAAVAPSSQPSATPDSRQAVTPVRNRPAPTPSAATSRKAGAPGPVAPKKDDRGKGRGSGDSGSDDGNSGKAEKDDD